MQYDSTTDFPSPSKLSKRYGREIVNYYAGSPLNRLSFLRSNPEFLRAALPHAYLILLNNLNALTSSPSHLAFIPYAQISALLESLFEADDNVIIANYDSTKPQLPTVLFLGVDEKYEMEGGKVPENGGFEFAGGYEGRPYFAVDVTEVMKEGKAQLSDLEVEGEGRQWLKPGLQLGIVPREAAMLAQARSLLDWNARNQYCAACGSKTISVQAGTKKVCPASDKALGERPPCISRSGIHNMAFPRTDASVIMAIISPSGNKILLGRQSRWPRGFYSTLAGFLEPGESIEEAVRRETWEESGVRVGRVVIHSSQPWPYPANIMIGCIGEALEGGDEIHLGHDPELEDARWFDMDVVREALGKARVMPGDKEKGGNDAEAELRVPTATAIAHQLMLAAVNEAMQVEAKI